MTLPLWAVFPLPLAVSGLRIFSNHAMRAHYEWVGPNPLGCVGILGGLMGTIIADHGASREREKHQG